MAETRLVDFNALPRPVRERLVECFSGIGRPAPILSSVSSFGGAVAGWVSLALVGVAVSVGAWAFEFGRRVQPAWAIALHGLGAFLVVYSILSLLRRIKLKSALPFRAGRFLLPMDFIDAQDSTLRIIPMNELIDFRGVHQHTNGVYTGTTLTFTFEGGIRENFFVSGKHVAEEAMQQFQESRRLIREALEAGNGETIYHFDPLFEVRMNDGWNAKAPTSFEDVSGPAARPVGGLFARKAVLACAGASLIVVGGPVWFARNVASDEAMYQDAKRSDSPEAFELYLDGGGRRHAEEVRTELLPKAALKEAKEKGTVTALREFLNEYKGSVVEGDAREALHGLFVKTRDDFHDQAATTDPHLLPFMDRLIEHLESHENTHVETRFHSPSLSTLKLVDAFLTSKAKDEFGNGTMIPVAPHFTDAQSIPREASIVKGLQEGFSVIFPADIMELSQGARVVEEQEAASVEESLIADLKEKTGKPGRNAPPPAKKESPPAAAPIEVPTLDIRYKVGWAGDTYTEEKGNRRFVGIVMTFNVSMQIPAQPETFSFDLEVSPPDHFTVDYSRPSGRFNTVDLLGNNPSDGPSEGQVYDVMAERAFDQLTSKLRTVFFRPGSKAFEGTQGPSDDDTETRPNSPRLSPPTGRGTEL